MQNYRVATLRFMQTENRLKAAIQTRINDLNKGQCDSQTNSAFNNTGRILHDWEGLMSNKHFPRYTSKKTCLWLYQIKMLAWKVEIQDIL